MDKDKMALFISLLTDEEKKSLRLVFDASETSEDTLSDPVPKSKRKQIRKKATENVHLEDVPDKPKRRRVGRLEPDDEDEYTPTKVRKSRRGSANTAGKKAARVQPLEIGKKPIDFSKDPAFNSDKHITVEDKKNWKGKKPFPRSRVGYVEVTCTRCRNTYEVGAALAHKRYVCDGCVTRE